MADIVGVICEAVKPVLLDAWGGLIGALPKVVYFQVGEGGWYDPGTGRIPRDPDPTLTDLDATLDASRGMGAQRYAADERAVSTPKYFVPGDITREGDTTLSFRCLLDTTEFNDDGSLNYPEVWEIGLFDENGTMVVYGTFPIFIKNGGVQFLRYVKIDLT